MEPGAVHFGVVRSYAPAESAPPPAAQFQPPQPPPVQADSAGLRAECVHLQGQLATVKRNFAELSRHAREVEAANAKMRQQTRAAETRAAQTAAAAEAAREAAAQELATARHEGRAQAEQAAALHARVEQAAAADAHRKRQVATQRSENEALAAYAILLEGRVAELERLRPLESQLELTRADAAALRERLGAMRAAQDGAAAALAQAQARTEQALDDWRAVLEDKAALAERLEAATALGDEQAARLAEAAALGDEQAARLAEAAALGDEQAARAAEARRELDVARADLAELRRAKERADAEAAAAKGELEAVRRAAGVQAQQIREEVRVVKGDLGSALQAKTDELAEARRLLAAARAARGDTEAQLLAAREERQAREGELARARDEAARVGRAADVLRGELQSSRAELESERAARAALDEELGQARDERQALRLDLSAAQRSVTRFEHDAKQHEAERRRRAEDKVSKAALAQSLTDMTVAVEAALETREGFEQAMGSWETARAAFRHLVHEAQTHMDEYGREVAKQRRNESVVRGNVGNLVGIFAASRAAPDAPEKEHKRLCATLGELSRLRSPSDPGDGPDVFWKPSEISDSVLHDVDRRVSEALEPVLSAGEDSSESESESDSGAAPS